LSWRSRCQQCREQRAHAHAHHVQHLVLADDLAVLGAHGLEPVLGLHAHEVLGLRAVARQRERVRDETRVLQALVHRAQVVLRAAQP
jgi:hypothetical protein